MVELKKIQKFKFLLIPVKLLPHLFLKQTVLTSHRRLIYRHSDSKPQCQQ